VTEQAAGPVRLRGGVTVPSQTFHRLNASWPWGVLVATESGIEISATLFADRWTVRWDDIEIATFTARSLVMLPKRGRGARFLCLRRSGLKPILRTLAAHGVPMRQVRSTHRAAWTL